MGKDVARNEFSSSHCPISLCLHEVSIKRSPAGLNSWMGFKTSQGRAYCSVNIWHWLMHSQPGFMGFTVTQHHKLEGINSACVTLMETRESVDSTLEILGECWLTSLFKHFHFLPHKRHIRSPSVSANNDFYRLLSCQAIHTFAHSVHSMLWNCTAYDIFLCDVEESGVNFIRMNSSPRKYTQSIDDQKTDY